MNININFDYYYGIESEQFAFFRIPKLLIKDARFKELSNNAKLLYGLMLDRMSLSMKNGWLDDENRVYIIYTVDTIMEDLGCAKATCVKIMKELDTENGIGLIEKKRVGCGKPDIIYVKNFSTITDEKTDNADKTTEVQKLNLKKSNMHTSISSEIEPQEVQDLNTNNTNINNTNISYMNQSNLSNQQYSNIDNVDIVDNFCEIVNNNDSIDNDDDMCKNKNIDIYIELIKKNIEYDYHMTYDNLQEKELYDELFEIICDVVCVPRNIIRIGKEEYPYQLVKSKFLKLNSSHLEYVIDCVNKSNTIITNIKQYLITSLYNAPNTMCHYYKQEARSDVFSSV